MLHKTKFIYIYLFVQSYQRSEVFSFPIFPPAFFLPTVSVRIHVYMYVHLLLVGPPISRPGG